MGLNSERKLVLFRKTDGTKSSDEIVGLTRYMEQDQERNSKHKTHQHVNRAVDAISFFPPVHRLNSNIVPSYDQPKHRCLIRRSQTYTLNTSFELLHTRSRAPHLLCIPPSLAAISSCPTDASNRIETHNHVSSSSTGSVGVGREAKRRREGRRRPLIVRKQRAALPFMRAPNLVIVCLTRKRWSVRSV